MKKHMSQKKFFIQLLKEKSPMKVTVFIVQKK